MKNLNFLITLIMSFFLLLTLTSCSSIGLLDDEITYKEINGFGDFFKVYLILQISIIIIAVILFISAASLKKKLKRKEMEDTIDSIGKPENIPEK